MVPRVCLVVRTKRKEIPMANKLKNLRLTSVDMVRNGANQEADICLFKSADPEEDPATPTTEEKNIFKRFLNWLRENPAEEQEEPTAPIEKADEEPYLVDIYKSAITESLQSIVADETLSETEKNDMIAKSLDEYHEAMLDLFGFGPEEESLQKADDEEDDLDDWEWDGDSVDEAEEEEEVSKSADIEEFEEVEKFNPYHADDGKFTTASGGGGAASGGSGKKTTAAGESVKKPSKMTNNEITSEMLANRQKMKDADGKEHRTLRYRNQELRYELNCRTDPDARKTPPMASTKDPGKMKYKDMEKEIAENKVKLKTATGSDKQNLMLRNHDLTTEMNERNIQNTKKSADIDEIEEV